MSILDKSYRMTMSDGSIWDIPVKIIANNRADSLAHRFRNESRYLALVDTISVFEADYSEIRDWARTHMKWSLVKPWVKYVGNAGEQIDMDSEWATCDIKIV